MTAAATVAAEEETTIPALVPPPLFISTSSASPSPLITPPTITPGFGCATATATAVATVPVARPRPRLPRLITDINLDEPAPERLITAVARTLDLPRSEIQLFDSFADLGGDEYDAHFVSEICRRKGMDIDAERIMNCQTMAELQTHVKPHPPPPVSVSPITPELVGDSAEGTGSCTESTEPKTNSESDDVFSTTRRRKDLGSMDSCTTKSSRASADSQEISQQGARELENLLLSTSKVGKVCLLKPKAGPFDGQLVALVTLSFSSSPPESSHSSANAPSKVTALPPLSEFETHQKHIRSLRTALAEWGTDSLRPQVWITLRTMALTENGAPDARRLQTWVQNINEDMHKQIMKLQVPKPRQAECDTRFRQKPVSMVGSNYRESLLWREDDMGRIDWEEPDVEESDEIELFPLSAMQQLYFRTSMNRDHEATSATDPGYRFSLSIMLKIGGNVELVDVGAAVEALVSRHAMLRARFRLTDEGWAQIILAQVSNSYHFGHHAVATSDDITQIVDQAQAIVNPTEGPVFAAEYIRKTSTGEKFLYLVAHHLVVDLLSWRIIAYDLDELLQHGTLLSERSIPFPHWVDFQSHEMSQRGEEPALPFDITPAMLEYWDLEAYSNCYGDTEQAYFSLSPDLTSVLQTICNDVFRTETSDIFMAALLLSFTRSFPERAPPTIWRQEYGRDNTRRELNIMETVGWFTSLCPITIGATPAFDILSLIKLVKDTRRAIPRNGIPYFTSHFSVSEGPFDSIPVEIMFNCIDTLSELRRKDGVLEPIPLPGHSTPSLNSDIGSEVGRIALFEVSVVIDDFGARVECLYNKSSRNIEKIESWMQGFEHLVLETIGQVRYHEPELTLSDVPLLRTTYPELAKLGSERLQGLLPSVHDVETMFPISPVQQDILIAQSQNPESFHVHAIYELKTADGSPVDSTRLCAAWEHIVAAQPSMRSIFVDAVSEEGLFDQVVLRRMSPSMLFIDSSKPEETLVKLPAMRPRPAEPKHRLSVCRAPSRTFIRVDASQAICDLPSIHNLIEELSHVYSGHRPSTNEALLHTYLYHISSLDTSYSLEVWKVDLADMLPCHFPRLTVDPSPQIQQQSFNLEVTHEQIARFCRKRDDMSPAAIFQLAWALVLRAFVGMDRVVFGFQFSGRNDELLPGIQHAIGSYAANLPCAVDVSSGQTIISCLEALGEAAVVAKQHQNVTMAEIQHALQFKGEALFNTCLSFQDVPYGSDGFDEDSELRPSLVDSARVSDSDLSLTTTFAKGVIHAHLSSRNLSHNQAQNVMGTFERAIKVIIENPSNQVSEVDLFTDRDYAQLVVQDWEQSQRNEKTAACVHNLILQHAQSRPNSPAICSWDGDLTYGEFASYVSRFKMFLVNLGVGPGVTIPVVLDKNRWAPVVLLAVLQAGAAFVALDAQDKVTVEVTIKQLNPQRVIATETAWKDLGTVVLNLIIVNDSFFASLSPHMVTYGREPTPDYAACVFVSPGKTKTGGSRSIFFSHASLCSAFLAQGPALKIDQHSRVLQLSAFNMDIALVEILGTLVHGGCVCVPSAQDRMQDLAGAISRMGVTWTYMTSVLARRINLASMPSLKTLCFRTRRLDEDTYAPWLENRDILLAYGAPDVCPLGISITDVTKAKDLSMIPAPLMGRFWVLNPDDSRKLMPIGAIGELAIDSPVVTPHKFDPDESLIAPTTPVDSKPKSRYLKTGHRVRYLDDGNIQFISSIRDEVVVDGAIIDASEVEQQMRRCLGPGVDVAIEVVTTRDSIRVLVAFLELGDNLWRGPEDFEKLSLAVKKQAYAAKQRIDASLEHTLPSGRKLPAEHIPAVYIPLKHFPISTSLKINRRKLQRKVAWLSYDQLEDMSTVPYPAEIVHEALTQKPLPLTQGEVTMRDIWAQTLNVLPSDINASDSFLAVGGNKYLATELAVACRKAGVKISINDVLRGATLTEVSRAMDSDEFSSEPRTSQDQPSRTTSVARTGLPLAGFRKLIKDIVAPQIGVHHQDITDLADASAYQIHSLELGMHSRRADITCVVLNFNGPVRRQKLEAACEALVAVHPVLRTAFAVHDRRVYQVLLGSFKPGFERHSTPLWRLDTTADEMVKVDQGLDFRLNEPVTKFTFVDAGSQGTLVIRLSRAQIDDASVSLLVQDLISLYEDAGSVPPKSSFFDYMRAAHSVNYTNGIRHWKQQLEGAKMTQVVSHSKPYGPTKHVRAIDETIHVSSLGGFGMTFDTVVKAAWAVVLSTVSGSSDVLFGEVIQGHNIGLPETVDLASMVGPLANTIPVRVSFPSMHSTPLDLMQYVQGQRGANRRYEAAGILDLVQQCTTWSYWTRLSTVVHHRAQRPFDGVTTLNMGSTTFTYKKVEPEMQDIPDLLVCSTVESPERLNLTIKFAEDRISHSFAEDMLKLLISAVRTLTCYDTITRPMLASAEEIARSAKQIPLPNPAFDRPQTPFGGLLPQDQRIALQTLITTAWTEILNPLPLGVPESQIHRASFYDLWGSLLPAHFFAEYFNRELCNLRIPGVDAIWVSREDIVQNPSMMAQFELIVRKLRDVGGITAPTPSSSRRKTMSFRSSSPSIPLTEVSWSPDTSGTITGLGDSSGCSGGNGSSSQPLKWKNSIRRIRASDSRGSMRSLSFRAAGGWMKHRVSSSWDGSNANNNNNSSNSNSTSTSSLGTSAKNAIKNNCPVYQMTHNRDMDLTSTIGSTIKNNCPIYQMTHREPTIRETSMDGGVSGSNNNNSNKNNRGSQDLTSLSGLVGRQNNDDSRTIEEMEVSPLTATLGEVPRPWMQTITAAAHQHQHQYHHQSSPISVEFRPAEMEGSSPVMRG